MWNLTDGGLTPSILAENTLARVRAVLEESPVIVEHWLCRGLSSRDRLIFDDYDAFLTHVREQSRPGDIVKVWRFDELCRDANMLVRLFRTSGALRHECQIRRARRRSARIGTGFRNAIERDARFRAARPWQSPRGTFLRCIGTALLGVAASGCTGDKQADSVERTPASETGIQLTGVPFSTAVAIGQPGLLQMSGHILWVADVAGDPGLHALDAQTGELQRSFGPRGQGPGDFSARPFGLEVAPGDSGAIWAFDQGLQRLTRFEAPSAGARDVRTVQLQGQPRALRVAWIGASRIIGQSNSGPERFAIFGPDGSRLRTVPGQLAGPESIPIDARATASNASSRMCTWPGRGFVVAYPYFGRVEFFDTDATFVLRADVPLASEPVFTVQPGGAYRVTYDRRWYIGCAANREYVFALFSGRREGQFGGAEQSSASSIHVFDWTGRLRAVFALDRSVFSLAVNDDGTVLFAGSLTDAGIYRYALPAIGTREDR